MATLWRYVDPQKKGIYQKRVSVATLFSKLRDVSSAAKKWQAAILPPQWTHVQLRRMYDYLEGKMRSLVHSFNAVLRSPAGGGRVSPTVQLEAQLS